MLWTQDDNGYLVSVNMPVEHRCRMCGAQYKRNIENSKPWQSDGPDPCPACGFEHRTVTGIRFRNELLDGAAVAMKHAETITGHEMADRLGRTISDQEMARRSSKIIRLGA